MEGAGPENLSEDPINDEIQLRSMVDTIVETMIADNIAQKIFDKDERVGKDYWVLATPGAFDRDFIAVALLGHPEQVGVWSYTLLRHSRVSETSMESYFREFAKCDFGLVAINPHFFAPDLDGASFFSQLDNVMARIGPEKKCGFIGFSLGGGIVLEFLEKRPAVLEQVTHLVLIDPTMPNRPEIDNTRALLDSDALLFASEQGPGEVASVLLDIPAVNLEGIHGEMPALALSRIIEFCQDRGV